MSLYRSIGAALTIAFVLCLASQAHAQRCTRYGAKALAADATRATQWNWGWGSVYALASVGGVAFAISADNDDRKLALWVGVAKSTIATGYTIVNPIRIEGPEPDCHGLDNQLKRAAQIERKRHGWFAHAGGLALNLAAFAYVGYETDNYRLSARFAVVGLITGELAVFSSPNEVRAGGLGVSALRIVPQVGEDSGGLALGGVF